VLKDVIAPPPDELTSEINDYSVAILLTYYTARVLLGGDAEAREEEHSPAVRTRGLKRSINVPKLHTLCSAVPSPVVQGRHRGGRSGERFVLGNVGGTRPQLEAIGVAPWTCMARPDIV
jgi:hypothetical protein